MSNEKNILIIESDAEFANMIGGLMSKYGFETTITDVGEEGIRIAKNGRAHV